MTTTGRFLTLFILLSLVGQNRSLEAPQETELRIGLAFLGDMGTGNGRQRRVRDQIVRAAQRTRILKVIMVGDNVYENGEAKHFSRKFGDIYSHLFEQGIEFHAALGNHDVQKCQASRKEPVPRDASAYRTEKGNCWVKQQLELPEFGYVDHFRYYSVTIGSPQQPLAEVFVLDSNTLDSSQGKLDWQNQKDEAQIEWFRKALSASKAFWKLAVFHHPIYTPQADRFLGGHASETRMRQQIEELMTGQVDAVIQGHNHFYARMKPQNGVRYFVTGGGGKKPYRFIPDQSTVDRPDRGRFNHFLFVDLTRERFHYCAVDDTGAIRDGGWFAKGDGEDTPLKAGTCPPLAN